MTPPTVPHTRPTGVVGTATSTDLARQVGSVLGSAAVATLIASLMSFSSSSSLPTARSAALASCSRAPTPPQIPEIGVDTLRRMSILTA